MTMPGDCHPTRLTDQLKLPESIKDKIYDNRMFWEPWVEGADTLAKLFINLKKRGYANLPVKTNPTLAVVASYVRTKPKYMMQKKKH